MSANGQNSSLLNLHILIPGLLGKVVHRTRTAQTFPRFAHIEGLLSRGLCTPSGAYGYEAQLCAMFGLSTLEERDLPLGALRHYGFARRLGKNFLICADPVHLRTDMTQIVLMDSTQLDLKEEESNVLIKLFNDHFDSEGFHLKADSVDQWHLRLDTPQSLLTQTLRGVRGNDINRYLPSGERAMYWQGILNETQMLYHNARLNRMRESSGALSINSLWFYGAGTLPRIKKNGWCGLWSQDSLAYGLCLLAGVDVQPLPSGFDRLLTHDPRGVQLICLDCLATCSSYDNMLDWQQAMQQLEIHWFAPLARALSQRVVSECTLWDCCGQGFRLRAADRWKFWRKPLPLYYYLNKKYTRIMVKRQSGNSATGCTCSKKIFLVRS